jgi:prepilin-type N-terminal cleavage/methylation domain-containing protein
MMNRQRGFNLIELIIVIVVVGIMSGGLMLSFNVALQNNLSMQNTAKAIELAESRMDFLLGYRNNYGYSALTADPCVASPLLAICTVPSGYTVTSTISAGNGTYKTIKVVVSGSGSATLVSEVYNY